MKEFFVKYISLFSG